MRIRLLTSMLLLAASANTHAQGAGDDAQPLVVTTPFHDRAQLQSIAGRFEHPIVDRARGTVQLQVTAADVRMLRAEGFVVTVDQASTAKLRGIQDGLRKGAGQPGAKSIPGFACYRTVEETYATVDRLVAEHPAIAQVADIGPSWAKSRDPATGYEMRVLRLSNTATDASLPDKPTMVVFGSIHAREYAPAELVTRFAEWLADGYGNNDEATWLLDNFQFHLVLQANPDGRKKAEAGALWRKNIDALNGSCSASTIGVDLNRNFPFHWNTAPGGSSGNACQETYRGPVVVSEPETQNLVRLVAGTPGAGGTYSGGLFADRRGDAVSSPAPDDTQGIFFDIHSAAELVLWSWGDTSNPAPNSTALQTLGRRFAYLNHYYPQQSDELYATDGTTDDTMYGLLGVPSYTIELGGTFFESCASFQSATSPDNLRMLRYAARNLHAPYKLPAGPDTTAIAVSATTVAAGTPVTLTATVDDAVSSTDNGTEPTQAIASARAFLDAPPWTPGVVSFDMQAADGAFNTTRESLTASIPTTGLAAGVHTLYVQGTDASGKPGTPNAVRFTVGGGNVVPVAAFSASSSGLTATFTNTSSDSDGSIATQAWDFGDGSGSTLAAPVHAYAAAGSYTVVLTVTDNAGATASATRVVVVAAPGDVPQVYGNGTDVAIPDSGTADSAIVVAGRSGLARAVTVSVHVVHPRRGDIALSLVASDGSVHRLRPASGGSADDLTATYKLSLLPGRPRNGTWTLRVTDVAAGDVGTLDAWSLKF